MPTCFEFLDGSQIGTTRYQQTEKVFVGFNETGQLEFSENSLGTISRPLAEVHFRKDGACLRNMDSQVCSINSQPVPVGQRRPLRSGDVVRFGPNVPSLLFSIVATIPTDDHEGRSIGGQSADGSTRESVHPGAAEPSQPKRDSHAGRGWVLGTAAISVCALLVLAGTVMRRSDDGKALEPEPISPAPQPAPALSNITELIEEKVLPGLVCLYVEFVAEKRFPHCCGWARSPTEIIGSSAKMSQLEDVRKQDLRPLAYWLKDSFVRFDLVQGIEADLEQDLGVATVLPGLTAYCESVSLGEDAHRLIGVPVWLVYFAIPSDGLMPHAYTKRKAPWPVIVEGRVRDLDEEGRLLLAAELEHSFGAEGAAVVNKRGQVIATVFDIGEKHIFAQLN